jgi:hypothetical protein
VRHYNWRRVEETTLDVYRRMVGRLAGSAFRP